MPATMTSLAAALIDDRTDRMIHDTFNQDVAAWEDFQVRKRSWTGDHTIIVIKSGRNNSVRSATTAQEPGAGQQGYLRLTIQAKRVMGSAEIDDFTSVSAGDEAGSVAVTPASELKGLMEDFVKKLCKFTFLGGPVIGMAWNKSNLLTTYGYRGRWDDVQVGNANNLVELFRMDTYASLGVEQVTAITATTITLANNVNTAAVPANVPIAVALPAASFQYSNDIPNFPDPLNPGMTMEVGAFVGDMSGWLTNLCQVDHWGNNKNTNVPVGSVRLRSNFAVCGNTNALQGDALAPSDLNVLQARILTETGYRSDRYWTSWITATAWADVLIGANAGNVRVDAQRGPAKLDPSPEVPEPMKRSFSGVGNGGIEIHCSDQCPNGLLFMIRNDGWERSFKGNKDMDGRWITVDGSPKGNPLIKVPGATTYKAVRVMYPEQTCIVPNSQGLLVGIADPV